MGFVLGIGVIALVLGSLVYFSGKEPGPGGGGGGQE
jgi:hypothetical protein